MATIATLYKSGLVNSNASFTPFPQGTMGMREATFSAPVLVLNDVIQMIPVFTGEKLLAVRFHTTDVDTNGTEAVRLDIGYGNSDTETAATSDDIFDCGAELENAAFVLSSIFSGDEDGGTAFSGASLVEFTANDTIDVHVQTAPATGQAGTFTMYAWITA